MTDQETDLFELGVEGGFYCSMILGHFSSPCKHREARSGLSLIFIRIEHE